MLIDWNESYSLGVEELDSLHRELFVRFNELISACDSGCGADEARRMLTFLKRYVTDHFTEEEDMLSRYGYPDTFRHKAEHDSFINELNSLEQQFQEQGATPRMVATINQTVAIWLIDHISRMDAGFARFLTIARR